MINEETGASEHYDVIVLGTGLKECILGGLLATEKKKVLVLDRNDFYGAESASLNLKQCRENPALKEVGASADLDEENFKKVVGRSKDFNIDLTPKLLMAGGQLVQMLLKTQVTRYLDFQNISGSYVFNAEKDTILEVPVTAKAAWDSKLLGWVEKKNFGSFLSYVNKIEIKDQSTWKASGLGWSQKFDLMTVTPQEMFKYFQLGSKCVEFVGHAVCLYPTDGYLTHKDSKGRSKMIDVVKRMQLYLQSVQLYEKTTSPYLYPMWGLGGLSEGFARLGAVHGSAFMLRRPVEKIDYHDDGRVKSVTSQGETATCDLLVCDPTYLAGTDKIKSSGFVARSILILDSKVPGIAEKDTSAQIIFPIGQTKQKCDIYVSMLGKELECAQAGRHVAVVSTRVASKEDFTPIEFVRSWLKNKGTNILAEFQTVRETFIGINQTAGDNIYICSSPDHTTHFQSATKEVQNLYHAITGVPLDLTNVKDPNEA